MPDCVVINTGPLIALATADALDVAGRLPFEFICPMQVCDELERGARDGLPAIAPPWLRWVALNHPPAPLALASIDLGEASVIQLALEHHAKWVCMHDWKGRRAALAVGLSVTGTLGLLARAKTLNVIPAVRPIIDRLLSRGRWFHPDLVRQILEQVGE